MFGNVAKFAPQQKGRPLAMIIGADGQTGNSVQIYDDCAVLRCSSRSPAATISGLVAK